MPNIAKGNMTQTTIKAIRNVVKAITAMLSAPTRRYVQIKHGPSPLKSRCFILRLKAAIDHAVRSAAALELHSSSELGVVRMDCVGFSVTLDQLSALSHP